MQQKKTLYELLGISPTASSAEIAASYQKASHELASRAPELSAEDADTKLKIIRQAYEVLSDDASRAAYDAGLVRPHAPVQLDAPLYAKIESKPAGWSSLKILLTVIAGLMATGMALQIGFMTMNYRHVKQLMGDDDGNSSAKSKAEEKVILQEYYQEHGVRAGSKIEADLLSEEARRKEKEQRLKEDQDRKYQQFVEEGRREGERIDRENRMAEEAARREQEYKQRQLEQEARAKKAAELARIENEKNKWRAQLRENQD